eukprot:TRINITY_DN16206_c0_g1_i1.p1 TRINITY_DN16206_c0_g1~~TRINITY_DN16206_c0_g1_i1.p1  ORF type:complete len:210 (+),score=66.52 TRINITY_DN16206_c0_g1_i1:131-760(+)
MAANGQGQDETKAPRLESRKPDNTAAMNKKMADGEKKMDSISHRVKELELVQNKLAEKKEKLLETLLDSKKKLEDKDAEVNECRKKYEEALKRLEAKKKKRDELQSSLSECKAQMSSVVKATGEFTKKTSYWCKELNGNQLSSELAVQRGYSCAADGGRAPDAPRRPQPLSARTRRPGSQGFERTGTRLGGTGKLAGANATAEPVAQAS